MRLSSFTSRALIVPDLRGGNAPSVIGELAQLLYAEGIVTDSLAFYHAALNREYLAPTQVSSVVAFPHARSAVVTRLAFAVGRAITPVTWSSHDVAQLVFLIAIPPSSSADYLVLMSALAGLIRNSAVRNNIVHATSAAEMFHLLDQVDSPRESLIRATASIDS